MPYRELLDVDVVRGRQQLGGGLDELDVVEGVLHFELLFSFPPGVSRW
jgi:hypothetical protein